MRTGSDPPDQGGIICVRREGAAGGVDGRGVGPAVIPEKPSRLDLARKILSRPLQAFSKTGSLLHRTENIDHHRGEKSVHLNSRALEAQTSGVGSEPITWHVLAALENS